MARPPPFSDLDAALAGLDPAVRRTRPARHFLTELAEARRIHQVAEPHRELYAALTGFDVAALDCLPVLIDRVEGAEVELRKARTGKRRNSQRRTRDEAISLRFRMVEAARFGLRDEPDLLLPLEGFHKRRRLPNLVGDLERLAAIGKKHPQVFAGLPGLPERPVETAQRLGDLLVRGPRDPVFNRVQGDRNAVTALLIMVLAEVRAGGRFLFRHDPKMLERFQDLALRTRRHRAKAERTQKQKPPQPSPEE